MSKKIINEEKIDNKEFNKLNLCLKNLTLLRNIDNSFCFCLFDNSFLAFNYNDISYLIYATNYKSIISYNIDDKVIMTEIKKAHEHNITNFRCSISENNNKCIIMSISATGRHIKIWNLLNWECILSLFPFYDEGLICSSCFLKDNNNHEYIISCCSSEESEIKIYDFSGNYIKSLHDSKQKDFFIDNIKDKKNSSIYIITGNYGYIKSYDYNKNKIYHKYKDNDGNSRHCCIKFNLGKDKVKLIDSCWGDDFIRIWDFHLGTIITKIKTNGNNIKSLCIYNDVFIFVSCDKHTIKLIDIINKNIVKTFNIHNNWVCTIYKLNSEKYGEFLISGGLGIDEMIKIWYFNFS